jgi:hypothetical protein
LIAAAAEVGILEQLPDLADYYKIEMLRIAIQDNQTETLHSTKV